MTLQYTNARITIDGVELPTERVSVQRAESPDDIAARHFEAWCDEAGIAHRRVSRTVSYESSGTFPVLRDVFDHLISLFEPPVRGASEATLARRVGYGGRKGRSALRRLFKRALPIEMSTDLTRLRGKAVWSTGVGVSIARALLLRRIWRHEDAGNGGGDT